MPPLSEHPTITAVRARPAPRRAPASLSQDFLRELCIGAGAADVGFVSIDRPELADERPHVLKALPSARTLISIVDPLHPTSIRAPARSVSNVEFSRGLDEISAISHRIVLRLEALGIAALSPSPGFPMEMDQFPGRTWVVSDKPIAVAAGLGQIGIHRSVIHPRFGSFIHLSTILVACEVEEETQPVAFNPCLECKLCVAACPVGAIEPDGYFNFSACLTHNYREFMTGFADWVDTIADAPDALAIRRKIQASEQASMWQSLSFGPNYKAAYCIAVCPAGENIIGPYLASKAQFKKDVVKPLQEKIEPLYVLPGSDAETHAATRFPHKHRRRAGNTLRPFDIDRLLMGMKVTFQRGKAAGLSVRYHFLFHGAERRDVTIEIDKRKLTITEGLAGAPDLVVRADTAAWLRFVRKECGIFRLILTRKLRIKGSPKLLLAFGRCFP